METERGEGSGKGMRVFTGCMSLGWVNMGGKRRPMNDGFAHGNTPSGVDQGYWWMDSI